MCLIDFRLSRIMAMKSKVGEFSLDLYYNDLNPGNPYTAKISWPNKKYVHFLGRSLWSCLRQADKYLKDRINERKSH